MESRFRRTVLALGIPRFAFDTTAILYVNLLFILLSVLPLWINTSKKLP